MALGKQSLKVLDFQRNHIIVISFEWLTIYDSTWVEKKANFIHAIISTSLSFPRLKNKIAHPRKCLRWPLIQRYLMPWASLGYEKLVKTFLYIAEVESILIKSAECRQVKLQHNSFNTCYFLQCWIKGSSNSVSSSSLILLCAAKFAVRR